MRREFNIEQFRHGCDRRLNRDAARTLDVEPTKPPEQRIVGSNASRGYGKRLWRKEPMKLHLRVCKPSRSDRLHNGRLAVKTFRRVNGDCQVHLVDAHIIGLRRSVTLDCKRCIAFIADRERDICRRIAQNRPIGERDPIEVGNVERLRFDQQPLQSFTCFFHDANTFLDVTNSTVCADQSLNAKF